MTKSNQNTPVYSIGAVARLTGLTTYALRMWEHRYQAVVAKREPNGRRIYSPADVEKLALLKTFVDRGTKISSIAGMNLEALHARAEQDQSLQAPFDDQPVRVAVMGASLPAKIRELEQTEERIRLVVSGSEPAELEADLTQSIVDTLVLEWSVLDRHSARKTMELNDRHAIGKTIVTYRFGRREEIDSLASKGIVLLQSPVNLEELKIALFTRHKSESGSGKTSRKDCLNPGDISSVSGQKSIPARLFNAQQLATLGAIESSIDCECPQHLSEILNSLGAFEVYSQNCEDLDDKDAALHAYLHTSTARARAIMEAALQKLIDTEGLSL